LQSAGFSQRAANFTDAGLSVVGSIVGGTVAAHMRAGQILATDPLAQGLTTTQLLDKWEKGSRALNMDDFNALGSFSTTALEKAVMLERGVDAAGNAYALTTGAFERFMMSIRLATTGPAPLAGQGAGRLGTGFALAAAQARGLHFVAKGKWKSVCHFYI
jgi:hypothetical protein